MMPSITTAPPPARPVHDHADEAFWLARLDANLPRASLVPDRRRTSSGERRYAAVDFSLDATAVRILKSLELTVGVSDLTLCTGLVAALLARYHREDELVVGLQWGGRAGESSPRPMLLSTDPDATTLELLAAVDAEVARVLAHPAGALAYLAQALGVAHSAHRCPSFDVAIAVGPPGATIDLHAHPVDVAFEFTIDGGLVGGKLHYAQELFDRPRMASVVDHLARLVDAMAGAGRVPVRTLDMLPSGERQRVLHGFNSRSASYPLQQTMHGLIEEQCRRTPDAVAAVHRNIELTYGELNRRANRLAHTLRAGGLGKGAFVGILLERSCDFLIAMLGTFKAGGAYVPLDPTYPRDRIQYMLADSAATVLISNGPLLARFGEVLAAAPQLASVVCVDDDAPALGPPVGSSALQVVGPARLATAPDLDPGLGLVGSDRAYMIYTSGSTGRPKGAICRHDGALNHLFGELDGIGLSGPFSFLQTAASSSDISVWQFVAPLIFGGSTVIADYEVVVDPEALFKLIRDRRVTLAEPVPVVLRALLDHIAELPPPLRALPDLHCMMVTGEALAAELVDRWLSLYPSQPIANTYGPTETSDDVTLAVLRAPIAARYAVAPIGLPLPNVRLFVLDRELQPVPVGVPGEICVGGLAVGEGYWRQPEKTLAAFVPCPFADVAAGPMYRTGDLGRWLADGQIEFLGRVDQQVKVRGFRVEPGEIEASIRQHPAVQDAAVVLADDAAGAPRLIGYYVLHKGRQVGAAELRAFLKESLAEHMIPAALTPLSQLPRTPLGKLDRKSLSAAPQRAPAEADGHVAPRSPTEQAIAAVWSRVVGAAKVGSADNFFEIGGDSISTIRVIAQLRAAGFRLAPRDIFQRPTLAALAEFLDAGASAPQPARHDSATTLPWDADALRQRMQEAFPGLEDAYPLAATQRGIYYQTLLLPKSSGAYIEQVAFDVDGTLDPRLFAKAWQHVVNTTDVLRAAVVRRGGQQPAQVVVSAAEFLLDCRDLRGLSPAERSVAVETLIVDERKRGFDLKNPPLMRVAVLRVAEQRSRVVWTYHHLILDGWSEGLVLSAVFAAYSAFERGQLPPAAPRGHYRDFVAWSEAQDLGPAEAYWRAALGGFDTPAVIRDSSPAVTPATPGEVLHGWCDLALPAAETTRLEEVARHLGVTLATVLHGAWALLMHRATALSDVLFGSVASGRNCELAGIDTLTGLVVVTQPLRSRPSSDSTMGAWLRLLQLQMAEMREHEHTPLAQIQQWSEVPAGKRPLFDTIVVVGNYAGNDLRSCASGGRTIGNVASYTQPLYALTLFVVMGPALAIRLVYEKKRYAAATAAGLLEEYRGLLAALVENPDQHVAGLMRRS